MNTQIKSIEEKRKEEINNYVVTIQAIQAFISLITWNSDTQSVYEDSNHWIGRRMSPLVDISEEGNNSPDVTPDIVLQKSDIGYIVEVKKTITKNNEYWDEIVDQLEKYSRPLLGWWTDDERITKECLILLIDISHSYEFSQYLVNNGIEFDKEFSLVEFSKRDGVNEFLFLRRYYGSISPDELNEYLSNSTSMPIEAIVGSYGELKFYDSEPRIVEYIMAVLWQNIFNAKKVEEGIFNQANSRWEFNVTLNELTNELQRSYGQCSENQRDVSFPKAQWIKKALDRFVDIGFAKALQNGEYKIYFKKLFGDIFEELINKVVEFEELEKEESQQLELFNKIE